MTEESAGEIPKLLRSANPEKSRKHRSRRRKRHNNVEGSSSQDEIGNDMEEDSSESCSEEDMHMRKPWKKFGKCPRFLETHYADLRSALRNASPFVFQKRQARIDWRTLHAIDVDAIIREIDIGKLETVLDTIAFGDIQGEDTRNFTEQNFIKLFRLAQLMIEYLLHAQDVLADHKSQLLTVGSTVQKRGEKLRLRCLWQRDALKQSRHDLKHARKTLKTYEILLRSNGKPTTLQQDLHISRRHPKSSDRPAERADTATATTQRVSEDKVAALVSRAEELTAARVRAETEAALEAEFDRKHAHGDVESAYAQVSSLQRALRESNNRLDEAQCQLEELQSQFRASSVPRRRDRDEYSEDGGDGGASTKRLRELEYKFGGVEQQIQHLNKENVRLRTELDLAYRELSALRSDRRHHQIAPVDNQMEDLQKQNQQLRKCLLKAEECKGLSKEFTVQEHARNAKAVREWVSETDERFSELTMGVTDETAEIQAEDRRSRHSDETATNTVSVKRMKNTSGSDEQSRQLPAERLVDIEDEAPSPNKQKWMKEHRFAPIPQMPYALSKYPHVPAEFASMQEKMTEKFEESLAEELKKFGISQNSEGISDDKFSSALQVLDGQRVARYSAAPSSERRIMEYERSTIQWHIERAVRTRDLDKIESIFEEETESSDSHDSLKSAASLSDDDNNFQDEENVASTSHDRREYSPEPFADSRSKARQSPVEEEFVSSKAFAWRMDDEMESQTFRLTGEVIAQRVKSPNSEVQHRIVISPVTSPVGNIPSTVRNMPVTEDEQVEEDLGLGDWESDDGKESSPGASIARKVMRDIQSRMTSPRAHDTSSAKTTTVYSAVSSISKKKGKEGVVVVVGESSVRGKKQHCQASSSHGSEESKMLDELDAEINEIIKM